MTRSGAIALAAVAVHVGLAIVLVATHYVNGALFRCSPVALACGALAGTVVFMILARRVALLRDFQPVALNVLAFATVLGVSEEVLWRGAVLSRMFAGEPFLGLVVSSVGFALTHALHQGKQALVHLLTCAVFGTCALAFHSVMPAIVAHWVYNLWVATASPPARQGLGAVS